MAPDCCEGAILAGGNLQSDRLVVEARVQRGRLGEIRQRGNRTEEVTKAAEDAAAALAATRRGLEIDLMEAQGDAVGALAARRQDELAALDESLRPLQEQIYAQLDLNAANEKALSVRPDFPEAWA